MVLRETGMKRVFHDEAFRLRFDQRTVFSGAVFLGVSYELPGKGASGFSCELGLDSDGHAR